MNKFNNGVVYVKKISPETILDDYSWLIDKAKLNDNFEKDITTFLKVNISWDRYYPCLLYTSPSPRDAHESRMPSSA